MVSESMKPLIPLLFMLATSPVFGDEVKILPLRFRTVEQVLPVLQPLVDPGGALTGMGSSLIIRSSQSNIEQIKEVLAAIDTSPRKLIISVRQDSGANSAHREGAVVRGRGHDPGVQIESSSRTHNDAVSQRVQTLEGNAAYISIGQSVPVPAGVITQAPGGTVIQSTVTQRDYDTGFYVVPRVTGDRVTLEISTAKDRAVGYGVGRTQGLATTAGTRLGEWVELGGVAQATTSDHQRILSSRQSQGSRALSVWVRVDEVR
jgi:hypothetical protein